MNVEVALLYNKCMIRYIGRLPSECVLAFSGGVDSVAIASFLLKGKKQFSLAYFDHETENSKKAKVFVEQFAKDHKLTLYIGNFTSEKKKCESKEEYWRNQRYTFFETFDRPVITAHHLNDAVETWLFNSFHGKPRTIPHRNRNVIRPFLITPKQEFISWCESNDLCWSEDVSNQDCNFSRNRIRNNIMPEALKVNPGLLKTVKKMYLSEPNSKYA